jgi:hypothetical protein
LNYFLFGFSNSLIARNQNAEVSSISMPSFTPIHRSSAPLAFINPLMTRHDRALDCDSIYDLPHNKRPAAPLLSRRRYASAVGGNGRLVSFVPLWEHQDGGEGMHCQSPKANGWPSKRKRVAVSKRSTSAKVPAKTWNETWEHHEIIPTREEHSQVHDMLQSQLNTPPDSAKHVGERPRSSKLAAKERKIGSLKRHIVTKPKASPGLEIDKTDVSYPRTASNHPGWTTTQEMVNFSKTTLDKLAAFRYGYSAVKNTLEAKPTAAIVQPSVMRTGQALERETLSCEYNMVKRSVWNDTEHGTTNFTPPPISVQYPPENSRALLQGRHIKSPGPQVAAAKELDQVDFDNDIDDADLMSLSLEPEIGIRAVVPATPTKHWGGAAQVQTDRALGNPKLASSRNLAKMSRILGVDNREDNQKISPFQSSGSVLDDEYPLDEGDEEEFLNLEAYETSVISSHELTASLNYGVQGNRVPGEIYGRSFQFSLSKPRGLRSPEKVVGLPTYHDSTISQFRRKNTQPAPTNEDQDWSCIRSDDGGINITKSTLVSQPKTPAPSPPKGQHSHLASITQINHSLSNAVSPQHSPVNTTPATEYAYILDDSQDYEFLAPFARPDFPAIMRDRSPVIGFSTQTFLRVCFRVGEMFKEGRHCDAMGRNAVVELFARVTSSSREAGTTKQHVQLADLWHNRPPYPSGVLINYKSSDLLEIESQVFVGSSENFMARCLGVLKRDQKSAHGWLLHIASIRRTDWEEIRWTKRIVSAGVVNSKN